jgi:hypothetical protein
MQGLRWPRRQCRRWRGGRCCGGRGESCCVCECVSLGAVEAAPLPFVRWCCPSPPPLFPLSLSACAKSVATRPTGCHWMGQRLVDAYTPSHEGKEERKRGRDEAV